MAPAPESTLHANTVKHSSNCEGAQPVADFAHDISVDAVTRKSFAKVQTGKEIPLRSTSGYILPENRWPKREEVVNKDTPFAITKKKYNYRQDQDNSWD